MDNQINRIKEVSAGFKKIRVLDMHTAGEPLRLILSGYPELVGESILEKRKELENDHDHLRKAIMLEPRGHADMYGALPVKATNEDAAFGVLFMHNSGYSTMCGHGTIAVAKAAWELGWVERGSHETDFLLEVPCGEVNVHIQSENTEIKKISFDNVPSFYVGEFEVEIPRLGDVVYDLAYGGAFYAYVDAARFGLKIIPAHAEKFISLGRQLKVAISQSNSHVVHPFESDLSFLYGVIFTDSPERTDSHSRNVCVFADGEIDRSPTGSGVSGRVAIHCAKGEIELGQPITIESIIGSTMKVTALQSCKYGPFDAVIPRVEGTAYFTGMTECWIDPADDFGKGFMLR